jgi:hypothetical protein
LDKHSRWSELSKYANLPSCLSFTKLIACEWTEPARRVVVPVLRVYVLTTWQISELKEHLDQIPTSAHAQDNNTVDIPAPDLLFGRQRHATKQELLAALPPRSEADQLIAAYFVSMNTAPSK